VLQRASEGLALDGMRLATYAPPFSVDLSADPGEMRDELFAVSALNDEDIWAVGDKGHILRRQSR
jgi:hypothetical protein